ncbi:MAG: hypothetical protein PHF51_01125 [Candidatus ainarchaeum sp.]|nr:hypothetical protein [Candidatus ainarchaeum sp.]
MDEKKVLAFIARVAIPAAVIAGAFWFSGLGGAQASPFALLAFAAAYVSGYAVLAYGESSLGLRRDRAFYAVFAAAAAAGALAGTGFVRARPEYFFSSIAFPVAACFALPAVFLAGMELVKNVSAERG